MDLFGVRERRPDSLDSMNCKAPALIVCAVLGLGASQACAQSAPIHVTVHVHAEDHRPVEGATVKSEAAHAATDASGAALLRLSQGQHAITVTRTRAERHNEVEPERVEVLAGEDVTEKALTRPGDVTTLVKEIAGVRP